MDANKDVKRLIIVSPMMWLIIGAAVFALALLGLFVENPAAGMNPLLTISGLTVVPACCIWAAWKTRKEDRAIAEAGGDSAGARRWYHGRAPKKTGRDIAARMLMGLYVACIPAALAVIMLMNALAGPSPGAMMYVMAGVGGLLSIRVLHSLVAPAVRDAAARWRKAGG